jgi:hypothetical protein
MTEVDVDGEEFLVGPPELVIPLAVKATAEAIMNDVVVASFVLVAFRDSEGRVKVTKAAVVESTKAMKRLGRTLRRLADEIESGEVDAVLVTRRQNSPGGDT